MLRHPPLTPKIPTPRRKRHQITSMMGQKHGPKINARGVHAAGSDPSDLGMMQPEGRPQQGKLKAWTKGIHTAGTDPRGLGMMQPWGRSQLEMKLERCHLIVLTMKGH